MNLFKEWFNIPFMQNIKTINNFLNETLNSDKINDIALNGIQVENEKNINKISFTVDASLNAIDTVN